MLKRGYRCDARVEEFVLAQLASLAVVLSALWLLLSGHVTEPLLLGLGAASVVLTLVVSHRMGVIDREGHAVHLALRALVYWPWLLKEILVANVDVAKAILGIAGETRPKVFDVTASQQTDLGKTISSVGHRSGAVCRQGSA